SAVNITGLVWHLCWCRNFGVSRALLDDITGRACDRVVTFVGGEHPRTQTNLDVFQAGRAFDLARRITRGRRVHDIHPHWQCQFPAERSAINFLRLVEPSPNRAGKVAVVTRKKCVSEDRKSTRLNSSHT